MMSYSSITNRKPGCNLQHAHSYKVAPQNLRVRRRNFAASWQAMLIGDKQQSANASNGSKINPNRSHEAPRSPSIVAPEDFTLPPGRLGPINRSASSSPLDIFRCPGCVDAACQGPSGCMGMPWRLQPGGYLREVLTAKVYDVAAETPLERAEKLSTQLGSDILLKREDLQPVKSFKLRGAYNKMSQLPPHQLEQGVICSSAGNHAQGVALSASRLNCSAVICMPTTTPDIKVAAVRALGGNVELAGDSYQETQAHAQARAANEGRVFIAPYDDPYTIAGQGTIAAEILRQCNMDTLDVIFVAIGGGGLVAGICAYVKALKPEIKVIGVEPTGANAMAQSLALGERVVLSRVDAFADGVAVKQVGAETFRICQELLDGIVLVDNASISRAIKDVFNETRSILEPSGAVAVAGAKAYLKHYSLKGQTVVAVTSGANMNFDRLRLVADLADAGETEAMLAVTLPERPGTFLDFVNTALETADIDVTEFKYRYSAGREAAVLFGVALAPGSKECTDLIARLVKGGYPAVDISDLELAQVHLRHLVGGHSETNDNSTTSLLNERIFQVEFPERPGALRRFLPGVSPRWLVTLFHYRRTGNRSSGVLLGLNVPLEDADEFAAAVAAIQADGEFTITEVGGREHEVFKLFLQ
jgi:threonine dehydratase